MNKPDLASVNHHRHAFMLTLRGQNQRFETLIQNADPKRRSREYCLCFQRKEDDFVSMHCALFEAIVRAQVNRKGVYTTSFKRGYMWFWLRSCLFCEGRISVLKRWFKPTPIHNAVHGSTVYASLKKKTISWACTAHCSRLLFELKWTGKAFIWRHLNVVICDFALECFHQNQRFALTTIVNAHFWAAFMLTLRRQNQRFETLIQNADPKRRSREYCLCFPREEDDFVSMHCALFEAIVRAQVNRKGVYMTSFKRGYMWICVHASTRISVLL